MILSVWLDDTSNFFVSVWHCTWTSTYLIVCTPALLTSFTFVWVSIDVDSSLMVWVSYVSCNFFPSVWVLADAVYISVVWISEDWCSTITVWAYDEGWSFSVWKPMLSYLLSSVCVSSSEKYCRTVWDPEVSSFFLVVWIPNSLSCAFVVCDKADFWRTRVYAPTDVDRLASVWTGTDLPLYSVWHSTLARIRLSKFNDISTTGTSIAFSKVFARSIWYFYWSSWNSFFSASNSPFASSLIFSIAEFRSICSFICSAYSSRTATTSATLIFIF